MPILEESPEQSLISILESHRLLRLTSPGRLRRWLGPALRGLVLDRLKATHCRFSPHERVTTRLSCTGCPHLTTCPVGRTLEAQPPSGTALVGQEDGVRPIVLAARFPLPMEGRPGHTIPVRATFIGAAAQDASVVWEALASPEATLGRPGMTFRVEPSPLEDSRFTLNLPTAPSGPELAAVRVVLTGPLLLRRGATDNQERSTLSQPTFAELLRGGLRSLGALLRYSGQGRDIDFRGLREAAERVPTLALAFRPFAQETSSGRRLVKSHLRGVVGHGVYGPVPLGLVRWLAAAGRVHVGLYRVAGAGGWRVWWDAVGDGDWQEMG